MDLLKVSSDLAIFSKYTIFSASSKVLILHPVPVAEHRGESFSLLFGHIRSLKSTPVSRHNPAIYLDLAPGSYGGVFDVAPSGQ